MEDKQLIMNMTLYASDHAAPCKNSMLYFKWMAAEMEEYYQQGDLERKLEFTVTPFFDRATCNPFKYQLGYIDVIVLPIFQAYTEFKENFSELLIEKGITENRQMLEQKVDETKNLQQQNNNPPTPAQNKDQEKTPREVQQDAPAIDGEGDKKSEDKSERSVTYNRTLSKSHAPNSRGKKSNSSSRSNAIKSPTPKDRKP